MSDKIKAGYRCGECNANRSIEVRVRAPEEGIENYVYHVNRMACEDHEEKSPGCQPESLDIELPITQNGIGFAGDPLTEQDQRDLRRQLGRKP